MITHVAAPTIIFAGFQVKRGDLFLIVDEIATYEHQEGSPWDCGDVIDLHRKDFVLIVGESFNREKYIKCLALTAEGPKMIQLSFARTYVSTALRRVSYHCDE